MSQIEETLQRWKESLCNKVSVGQLLSKNSTAHKWKATYRSLILRETLFWRVHDLLAQAHLLFKSKHVLGSRILIRSALESTAILIYLNQLTEKVIDGKLDFHIFDEKTRKLLLGSKEADVKHSAINIITVLQHCEKKFNGVSKIYADLSECAHPNYEGVCVGYSELNAQVHETHFQNNWVTMWANVHQSLMKFVCILFEDEYSVVWLSKMNELEKWLVEHDAALEFKKISND